MNRRDDNYWIAFAGACIVWLATIASARAQQPLPADHAEKMARGRDLFAKQVRQVLIDQCLKCHGGEKTRSGFDLSSRESLLKGGDNGPAIVPGNSKDSRLVKLVTH